MKMPQEAEKISELVLDSLSELVLFIDPQMRIQWTNRAAVETAGRDNSSLDGRHCYEVWQRRREICPECPIARVFETGQPQEGEITSSEKKRWSIRGYPIRDEKGEVVGAAEIAVEITALKQAQEALEKSEAKYAALLENAQDAIVILQDGICRYINKAAEDIYGYTIEELQSRPFIELVAPEFREKVLKRYQSQFGGEVQLPQLHHAQVIHKDGTRRYVESTGAAIEYEGKPAILGIFRDVTDREKSEQALRESEERFRALSSGAFDGVVIHEKGIILEVNEAFNRIFGFTREEVIGKPILDFAAPESRETVKKNVLSGHDRPYPAVGLRKDGTRVYGELLGKNVRYKGREARVTAIRDLTEHKKVENELRESEERYRSVIDTCPDAITLTDLDGKLITANEQAARLYGCDSVEELLSSANSAFDVICPEDRPRAVENTKKTLKEGIIRNVEYRMVRKDGTTHPAELSASTILDAEGKPRSFVGVVRDITERKQTEEAMRASEEFSSSLLNSSPHGIIVINPDTSIQYINRAMEKLTGYSAEEIVGRKAPYPWWPEDVRGKISRDLERSMSVGVIRLEEFFRNKNGEIFWVEISSRRVKRDGKLICLLSNWVDITERKRAEEALRESEAKYSSLVEQARDGVMIFQDGVCRFCNRAVERIGYRVEDLVGKPFLDFVSPDFREQIARLHQARLEGKEAPRAYETRILRPDGSELDIEVSAGPIVFEGRPAFLGIFRDISERKRAEQDKKRLQEQIQHAQKLESLGILAGGIAHDFNNLLMGVLGNASLALLDLPEGSPVRHSVEQIEKTARAAADLTNQMLAYSGKGRFIVEPVDLSRLVEEMAGLLKVSISKKVTLKFDFDQNLPPVEADATQLRQVIMNLITNASEAIGESSGIVSVRTGSMQADGSFFKETYMRDDLPPGNYVYLEVSDTGCGMDPEVIGRIFDPFYTTKFTGRGLGLAAVLGIVRGHNGAVRVQSQPEEGTAIRVVFPPSEGEERPETPAAGSDRTRKASGKILVVDDEASIRDVSRRMLESRGFEVLTAKNGREAVELYRTQQNDIAAVLLDATMPHMDGLETFEELRRIRGDARVILSSGYSEQEATERFTGKGLTGFIQKPYRLEELTDKLQEVLGK
jgi:two-component system cell cycle sensor histidine kinase/response regulator CckA